MHVHVNTTMETMETSCCLCGSKFSGSGSKARKALYGSATKDAICTFQSICREETGQPLESLFSKSTARQHWLCRVCDRQLLRINRYVRDLEQDKKTVGARLLAVHIESGSVDGDVRRRRRRDNESMGLQQPARHPPAKSARLSESARSPSAISEAENEVF